MGSQIKERDRLKKEAVILSLLIVVLVAIFAGCIGTSNGKIEGIVYNNTDERVKLKAECKSGGHQDIERNILANSTDKFWLYVGTWDISVWYKETGIKIDTETLIVQSSDEWFDICVYDSSITADAY